MKNAPRSIAPEYPSALRRREAEGTVIVRARKADADSAPELAVANPSSGNAVLRQFTLDVVSACFANLTAHQQMPAQQDFFYRYQWILR